MDKAPTEGSAEALWADLRFRLDRVPNSTDPLADVAAAAGLFDVLSNAERVALARYMYEELRAGLRKDTSLTPLQHSILGLVDPYITNSDLESEARILLSNALAKNGRTFEDEFAIAHGLIDLNFRVPGSDEFWTGFYARHAENLDTRYDAFDLALAGLAPWNLTRFNELIDDQPAERWLIDRIDMFLPTLTRSFTPAQVSALVHSVYDRCQDPNERERLVLLADAYALSILKLAEAAPVAEFIDAAPVHLVPVSTLPEALRFANFSIENERRCYPEETQLALDQHQIHVYRSSYTGQAAIDRFQNAAVDKIRELAGPDRDVPSSESAGFTELYSSTSLDRKAVFAFPTYLTAAKRHLGYSCASFGLQRRIGILFPEANRLAEMSGQPTSLEETLREVMKDDGIVYCVRNYAISEIVLQLTKRDQQLAEYFDEKHLRLCSDRDSIPSIPDTKSRNFVFLFDLSGWANIEAKINSRRRTPGHGRRLKPKNQRPHAWMKGAKLAELSHSATIEVGLVFSKYMVEWLLKKERWTEIEAFVASWADRPDFKKALKAIGVDVGGLPPPADDDDAKPYLQAVNDQGRIA